MGRLSCFILILAVWVSGQAQSDLKGKILDQKGRPLPFIAVALLNTAFGGSSDSAGNFELRNIPPGKYQLVVKTQGFANWQQKVNLPNDNVITVFLRAESEALDEVVVTGTLKEVGKDESPVNIDVITPALFQKTSTPNLFEATSLVNGVKPQINCNVCNTGDIHINGLEGPYTLILIDGMPIVSGLSSVYGLMGIPASMIERLEIAKGPASALYGSEAMGGTINLITKNPGLAPRFYADHYISSYLENNLDLSAAFRLGKKANLLSGVNAYYFDEIWDINQDGFTDLTLQKRISTFHKLSIDRPDRKEFSMAARYVYEDRWGGENHWKKEFRGGDSVYGESIYTNRLEFISRYQWPLKEQVYTQISYNLHDQDSWYGTTPFMAFQSTAFAQTYWTKRLNERQDFLMGITYKHLWFDDNTLVTQSADGTVNHPESNHTYGMFVQNESMLDNAGKHKLLLGFRGDYNNIYQFIPSPRLAYKWSPTWNFITRLNFGTGFRIVNVFTEDHAALTGARQVVFIEKIRPEQSYNGSLNFVYKMKVNSASMLLWDATAFYYHFTNKIYANYDEDPNKVVYNNLSGYAFSRGGSLNTTLANTGNFKFILGATYADVQNVETDSSGKNIASWQLQAPRWSGNIIVGYQFPAAGLKLDVTGNWYGPQRLPVLPADFRPEFSPWFCLLNFQTTKSLGSKLEMYAGVKNILNFIPENPIMRPFDPFDKNVNDPVNNPNGYTFDPSYNYAPIQGIRGYFGLRLSIR